MPTERDLFVRGFSAATLHAINAFRDAGSIPEGLNATSGQHGDGFPQHDIDDDGHGRGRNPAPAVW